VPFLSEFAVVVSEFMLFPCNFEMPVSVLDSKLQHQYEEHSSLEHHHPVDIGGQSSGFVDVS
jgi:hypothetical protein